MGLQDRAQTAKERADSQYRQGDFAGAVELYSKCLQLDPGKWELHSNRCTARLKISDFVGAVEDADQALKSQPENTRILARCEPMSFAQIAMVDVPSFYASIWTCNRRSISMLASSRKKVLLAAQPWTHLFFLSSFGHASLVHF